ncbi:MAG: hypothetical protein H6Q90_4590 [Deltaproteobacteria bacterium]|nr:hypothetical protein [Deltaproteobacteria bacterium]
MVDRQDLDALLVSALYGELTPAEEARLQTHLDSHPTDRTALADLTLVRTAVRDSRIFQVQLDPPQSISALLLQEAARRAPRSAKPEQDQADRESWFQRFVRSFVSHPAMAAAAMLVVVVGVAGTLYLRGNDQFAEQSAQAPASPSVARLQDQFESDKLKDSAGSAFAATLEEGRFQNNQNGEVDGKLEQGKSDEDKNAGKVGHQADAKGGDGATGGEGAKVPGNFKRSTGDTYLSTERADLRPKDLEPDRRQPAKKAASQPDQQASAAPADDSIRITSKPSGAAATAQPRPSDAPNGGMPATGSSTLAPPPPPVVAANTARDGRQPVEKPSDNKSRVTVMVPAEQRQDSDEANLLSWAKDLHTRVVAQVRAGNCKDATSLALTLSNRAPNYFAQNVENDRAVKTCIQYINAERERAAEKAQRARAATKRAEEPAKAPPAK